MKDQKKAGKIACERMQMLAPLPAEGLDSAQMRKLREQIREQTGLSDRTLCRYLAQYRAEGLGGLKLKDRSSMD